MGKRYNDQTRDYFVGLLSWGVKVPYNLLVVATGNMNPGGNTA